MEENDLRQLLEKVHAEIEKTATVDEKARQLLSHLEMDIRDLLEKSDEDIQNPHPSVIDRLEEGIETLEVTHPTLTLALDQVLRTLSNAGI